MEGNKMASENKKGTTYNLATSQLVEGKKVWTNWGTLFIREGGVGGIMYLKQGDHEITLGVFRKRSRDAAPEQGESASTQS
jgi:hypothetical protein